MKLGIIGATGFVGSFAVEEALRRDHAVTSKLASKRHWSLNNRAGAGYYPT